MSSDSEAASRLCAACGMCCDGTLFYAVHLQANDSPKELRSLGLRLKTKRGVTYFPQPCLAFRKTHCAIYDQRPERCRLFNCRQIQRLQSGETSEETALEKIRAAREQVEKVRLLLHTAGATNPARSLPARYELAIAQPIDAIPDPISAENRADLIEEMRKLDSLLTADFRIEK